MSLKIDEYGKIVCAALLHDNCIYMGRKGHHEIFPMEKIGVLRCAEQGFVTENGYFVDRTLGLEIATYYDQINKKHNPIDKLVSEDLKKNNLRVKKRIAHKYKEKQEGIIMKTYLKEQLLQEIILILKFYNNEKENLLYANFLMNKINNDEVEITISSEEISTYLFKNDSDEINQVVLNSLRHLNADLSGVDFSKKNITGINFSKLEGVEINLDNLKQKDFSKTCFYGVKLSGTLDNANIEETDFSGYIGDLVLNPQRLINSSIKGSKLSGVTINGNLDDIDISHVDFTGVKGNPKINPQTIPKKELSGINFCDIEFCGNNEQEDPSFDGCKIYDCKFKGVKGNVTINLDTLDSSIFPKLAICDLTNVTVIGTAKSNYLPLHCVKKDGTVIFDTVGDDLFGSYYYDDEGNYVHIYLYESMVWDNQNSCWKFIPRKKEKNLKINVQFNSSVKKEKTKILSKILKK